MGDILLNGTAEPNGPFALMHNMHLKDTVIRWTLDMVWQDVINTIALTPGKSATVILANGGTYTIDVSYDISNVYFLATFEQTVLYINAGVSIRNATTNTVRVSVKNVEVFFVGVASQAGDLVQLTGGPSSYFIATTSTPCFPSVADGSFVAVHGRTTLGGSGNVIYAPNGFMTVFAGNTVTFYLSGVPRFNFLGAPYAVAGNGNLVVNYNCNSAPDHLPSLWADPALTLTVNNPYVRLPNVGTAGIKGGSPTFVKSVTLDANGRVASAVVANPPGFQDPTDPYFDLPSYLKELNNPGGTGTEGSGIMFMIDRPLTIKGTRWYHPVGFTAPVTISLFYYTDPTGPSVLLAQTTGITAQPGQIMSATFPTPYLITDVQVVYHLSVFDGVHRICYMGNLPAGKNLYYYQINNWVQYCKGIWLIGGGGSGSTVAGPGGAGVNPTADWGGNVPVYGF